MTETQFSAAVQSLLQQSQYSPAAAESVYTQLQNNAHGGPYITNDAQGNPVVTTVPSAANMQAILVDSTNGVYPQNTPADSPQVVSLSSALISLLEAYNNDLLPFTTEIFISQTNDPFTAYLYVDNLTQKVWQALQATAAEDYYISAEGIVTQTAVPETIKALINPVLFPQIPAALLDAIVTLILGTFNKALQLQQRTLSQHLASLYQVSTKLAFALETWGGLAMGDLAPAQAPSQGAENAYATTPLLRSILQAAGGNIAQRLQVIQPYAQLLTKLSLSPADAQALVDHPGYFGITYPTPIPNPLQAYWSMNEPSGIILQDNTTKGNDGKAEGATWAQVSDFPLSKPRKRHVLEFNGTSDYAEVPYAEALNSPNFTMACWVKPTSTSNNRCIIHSLHNGNYGYTLYTSWGNSGKCRFFIGEGGTDREHFDSTNAIAVGAWAHVSVTYDGATAKIYINGTLDKSLTLSKAFQANTDNNFYIGITAAKTDAFEGQAADVGVWNTALSAQAVKALHDTGVTFPSQPQLIVPDVQTLEQ
ncbi:MAG: LamG domain-containing protein, partial [Bacteroidota bacterium]